MIKNDNKWQGVVQWLKTNESEWEQVKEREWFWFHDGTRFAMYNYNIFSNIDNLQTGKLMTYILNMLIFCVSIMQVFLHVFHYLFC